MMSDQASAKELAYLQDLFIAPDWGERFAELIDEHVVLPESGRALYLGIGTGGHAIALTERAGSDVTFWCVDESDDCLELARTKAASMKATATFQAGNVEALDFPDEHFDLVVGDASLLLPRRFPAALSEMVRVAINGGTVALVLPTASSFGEFFSIYWEALHGVGLVEREGEVESLITELPAISDVEEMAVREGLEDVSSWTRIEEFDYDSGEEFLKSPLIAHFLMQGWLLSIPEASRTSVSEAIVGLINEERHRGQFSLTVKATLVSGKKAGLPLVC